MLKQNLVFQVSDLFRAIKQEFTTRHDFGLTGAQGKMLIAIWRRQGINQQALAKLMEISTMSVCRQVDSLEEKGLIERRPGNDRRVKHLYTTEKAQPDIEKAIDYIDGISKSILSPLSTSEQNTLSELINRVLDHRARQKEDQ